MTTTPAVQALLNALNGLPSDVVLFRNRRKEISRAHHQAATDTQTPEHIRTLLISARPVVSLSLATPPQQKQARAAFKQLALDLAAAVAPPPSAPSSPPPPSPAVVDAREALSEIAVVLDAAPVPEVVGAPEVLPTTLPTTPLLCAWREALARVEEVLPVAWCVGPLEARLRAEVIEKLHAQVVAHVVESMADLTSNTPPEVA